MKRKRQLFNPYGLQKAFALSVLLSAFICCIVFLILSYSADFLLTRYFDNSDFTERQIQKQGLSLQDFIAKNEISSSNLNQLQKWERKQPVILLELYSEGKCIYSSAYDNYDVLEHGLFYDFNLSEPYNHISIKLSDKTASAIIYSDFTYQYYVFGKAVSAMAAIALFIIIFLNDNRRLIHYICRLNDEVQILEGGNLDYQVSVEGNDEITDLAKSMNRMRKSFKQQIETEHQLQQNNKKLITEMSHDLRTPLTGIMLYLEILKSHRYSSDEELQDYLNKIYQKAHHMKLISDHLFEYSKDGFHNNHTGPIEMKLALQKELENLKDDLEDQGFKTSLELKWESDYIQIDKEFIHRIIGNIFTNILKYAERSTDVQISTIYTDKYCGFSVINACKNVQNDSESNEIGISSIQSMMTKMDGICTVEQTDTVFEITLLFPKQ